MLATALPSLLDQHNLTFDGCLPDGHFDIGNPIAFAAGSQNNNDILTQSYMLCADDCNEFVKSQMSEITGLHDFGVFEYLPRGSLPKGARLHNAIWSYHHK